MVLSSLFEQEENNQIFERSTLYVPVAMVRRLPLLSIWCCRRPRHGAPPKVGTQPANRLNRPIGSTLQSLNDQDSADQLEGEHLVGDDPRPDGVLLVEPRREGRPLFR